MKISTFLISIGLAYNAHAALAGTLRDMSTDNGGVTNSPYTVDAGHVQLESEIFNRSVQSTIAPDASGQDERQVHQQTVWNNLTAKAGVTDDLDLELNFVTREQDSFTVGGRDVQSRDGAGDTTLQAKLNLLGNDGGDVAVSLMPFLKFPTNSGGIGNKKLEGGLFVPINVNLPDGYGLGLMPQWYYLISAADPNGAAYQSSGGMSAALSHSIGAISESLSIFGELSNLATPHADPLALAAIGLVWQINGDWQVDGGSYFGMNNASPDYQLFAGLSVRF